MHTKTLKVPALPPAVPSTTHSVINQEANTNFAQALVPIENAVTPYQPPELQDSPNFDLMSLIQEVQNDELSDDQLLLAATQCEAQVPQLQENIIPTAPFTTNTTTSTTAVMRKVTNPTPTFTNCTFGTIGTLNIHVHKNQNQKETRKNSVIIITRIAGGAYHSVSQLKKENIYSNCYYLSPNI